MGAWRKFRQGQADYQIGRPRPITPPDEDMHKAYTWRWVGWMIERGRDIQKIWDDLDRAGVRHTREGDLASNRRIEALDRQHGLRKINLVK